MGIYSIIAGTGSYISEKKIPNSDFLNNEFYGPDGKKLKKTNEEIIETFEEITGIRERRYVEDNQVTSDIASLAAEDCLESSNTDRETIDYIIVADNFGDVISKGTQIDLVPSIAARVKNRLGIENPKTLAYDLIGSSNVLHRIMQYLAYGERDIVIGKGIVSTNPNAAYKAAKSALDSSGHNKENFDNIVVTHCTNGRADGIACIAARVKEKLKIKNPNTMAYDIIFGCPGWLQGMIHADYLITSGNAKRILVIGAETLSKVSDPHDPDSMLYAGGGGATIHLGVESKEPVGMLSHAVRSDTLEKQVYLLYMDESYNPNYKGNELFLKMGKHKKINRYVLENVPEVIKESLDKAGLSIQDVKKVLLNQAGEKRDKSILRNLYGLYGIKEMPPYVMPTTVSWLGNSSVASLPTTFDFLLKGKFDNHKLNIGDIVVFASIGAGMNINSVVYEMV